MQKSHNTRAGESRRPPECLHTVKLPVVRSVGGTTTLAAMTRRHRRRCILFARAKRSSTWRRVTRERAMMCWRVVCRGVRRLSTCACFRVARTENIEHVSNSHRGRRVDVQPPTLHNVHATDVIAHTYFRIISSSWGIRTLRPLNRVTMYVNNTKVLWMQLNVYVDVWWWNRRQDPHYINTTAQMNWVKVCILINYDSTFAQSPHSQFTYTFPCTNRASRFELVSFRRVLLQKLGLFSGNLFCTRNWWSLAIFHGQIHRFISLESVESDCLACEAIKFTNNAYYLLAYHKHLFAITLFHNIIKLSQFIYYSFLFWLIDLIWLKIDMSTLKWIVKNRIVAPKMKNFRL